MKVERKTKVRSEEKIPKSTKKVRTRDKLKGIEQAADDVVILTYFSVLLGTSRRLVEDVILIVTNWPIPCHGCL